MDCIIKSKANVELEACPYFSNLLSLIQSLGELPEVNSLLSKLLEIALELSGMEAGSISLLEDKSLKPKLEFSLVQESAYLLRARLEGSLIGWDQDLGLDFSPPIFQTGVALIYEKQRAFEQARGYLGIPLKSESEFLGLLNLYSRSEPEIAPRILRVLNSLASQAAVMLGFARLLEKEKSGAAQARILWKAARELGKSRDIQEIFKLSLKALTELTGVNRCLIFSLDEKKRDLSIVAAAGLTGEQRQFLSYFILPLSGIEKSLWDDLREGKPVVLTGLPSLSPGLEELFNLLSGNFCLLTPLCIEDKCLGLIYLDDSRSFHSFTDTEVRLVMGMVVQAAIAIERARELARLSQQYNQLESLYNVALAVGGSLSLPRVYELITEKAHQLLGGSPVAYFSWAEEERKFKPESFLGLEESLLDLELLEQLSGFAARKKRPLGFGSGASLEGYSLEKLFYRLEVGGVLVLPLIARKRVLGVLHCFSQLGKKFTAEQFFLLRRFAGQSALAIQNAKVYSLSKSKLQELAILFELGKAITSTLNLQEVLDAVTRNVKKVVNADACSLMLLDELHQRFKLESVVGMGFEQCSRYLEQADAVLYRQVKAGFPVVLNDEGGGGGALRFPELLREAGFRSRLSVPLSLRGRVIGLINIYKRELRHFEESELNFLTTLGSQAALAIENARLYEEQVQIGKLLQDTLAPQADLTFPGLEVEHLYLPSTQLSGDYYDLIPLEGKKVAITMADVSGKGHSAAMYTVRAKYLLRALAKSGYPPDELLKLMNRLMYVDKEIEKFISIFYGVLDLEKHILSYALAGHDPPVFVREGKLSLLEGKGILIGVVPEAEFEGKTQKLKPGDSLILYTDGITEAHSPGGEFFGLMRLQEIVQSFPDLGPRALSKRIFNAVQKFTGKRLSDDFSLMIVRVASN